MIYIISGRGFVEIYVDIRIQLTDCQMCAGLCEWLSENFWYTIHSVGDVCGGVNFHHHKHSQNYLYQIAGLNATYILSLKMSGWRLY